MNFQDSIGERSREGRIEAISGGMFSGKSEELVRRLRRAAIARQSIQVFTPSADTRHGPQRLVTRDKRELEAVSVATDQLFGHRHDPAASLAGVPIFAGIALIGLWPLAAYFRNLSREPIPDASHGGKHGTA